MSDFLTNLATRHLHPSETLRPRLPALFEPASPRGLPDFRTAETGPLSDAGREIEELDVERTASPPTPRRPRRAVPAVTTVEITPADENSTQEPPHRERRRAPSDRTAVPVIAEAPHPIDAAIAAPALATSAPPSLPPLTREEEATAPPRLTPTAPHPTMQDFRPPPDTRTRRVVEEVVERTVVERLIPLEQPVRPRSDDAAKKEGQRSDEYYVDARHTVIPIGREMIASPPAAVVAQPQVSTYRVPAAPAEEPVTAAPTIHVTIGRVEVRAATPADTRGAQRPAQRPTGVMSLEEYLRRRKQGGAE